MTDKIKRTIRSFVRREGRITPSQKNALDTLLPRFGIDLDHDVIDFEKAFGRQAPCIFEIGFGMGDSLVSMALAHPENNYLGIDVHRPGLGNLLKKIEANEITNVRVMSGDAVEVLKKHIANDTLDAIYLFFFNDSIRKHLHSRSGVILVHFENCRGGVKNVKILIVVR